MGVTSGKAVRPARRTSPWRWRSFAALLGVSGVARAQLRAETGRGTLGGGRPRQGWLDAQSQRS